MTQTLLMTIGLVMILNGLNKKIMAQFRFETEVQVKATLEYFIEADTLEEATEQLKNGYRRCEGITFDEQYNWDTETITAEEKLKD